MGYEKLTPCHNPHIGCLNCGGGEFVEINGIICCNLDTRLYGGFGGWSITRDDEFFYCPEQDLEFDEYPTLREFEEKAASDPDHDWRAIADLPLRDATYQRQGDGLWVLVKSGMGFA